MITITTANKTIKWNYKRLLKNLYPILILIIFVAALLICGYMDHLTLIH